MITTEQLIRALPSNLKSIGTDTLRDKLNGICNDPIIADNIRSNYISYATILKEGKFKPDDYLNAVVFCSFRLGGDTNKDAYFKTFPDRYQAQLERKLSEKEMSSYISAYSKGKLVNLIMEQSAIPSWVLNMDMYQTALNIQLKLATDEDVSPKVRCDAANSLLTHLTKPKDIGPLINVDMRETSGMSELKLALQNMAKQQITLLNDGVLLQEIASQKIMGVIDNEVD